MGALSCIFLSCLSYCFICYEYDDYRFQCNVGLVEDGIDELHTTLLSVGVGALACLFVIACVGLVWTLRKSKVRPLKAESMDAALQLLHIDKFRGCVIYSHKSFDASPPCAFVFGKVDAKGGTYFVIGRTR